MPMPALIVVCKKPNTDDAVPATFPSGSMAKALKFAPKPPIENISVINRIMKKVKGAAPPAIADQINQTKDVAQNISSKLWDIVRIPNRPTNSEFKKAESALNAATSANAAGNQTPK